MSQDRRDKGRLVLSAKDEAEFLAWKAAKLTAEANVVPLHTTGVVEGVPAVVVEQLPATSQGEIVKAVIAAINKKHAVIGNVGGKCRILDWVPSQVDPGVMLPTFQAFDAFKHRYNDEWILTDEGRKKKGDLWLQSGHKSKFDGVMFRPGGDQCLVYGPDDMQSYMLNLWRGFAVAPKAGKWDLIEWHIREILARGVPEVAEYILNWIAWGWQYPGHKRGTAIVTKGPEGSGKGLIGHAIRRSYGPHGVYLVQSSQLTGKFNQHLLMCCFCFADEVFVTGDKLSDSILKSLITDQFMMVEPKGVDAFQTPNWMDVWMASNEEWVVPVGPHGRRFAVFDVDPRYAKDHCEDRERKLYFGALIDQIRDGGLAAMMWDLMQRPVFGWNAEEFPVTQALLQQKQRSLRGYDKWWEEILQNGELPRSEDWGGRPDCASMVAIQASVARVPGLEYESKSAIKDYLKRNVPGLDPHWRTPGKGNAGAKFPTLEQCRAAFTGKVGGTWNWDQGNARWAEGAAIRAQVSSRASAPNGRRWKNWA